MSVLSIDLPALKACGVYWLLQSCSQSHRGTLAVLRYENRAVTMTSSVTWAYDYFVLSLQGLY